jgi:DNA mismatch endonuclease (patch repair protein)
VSNAEYSPLHALRDTLVVSENTRRTMRANRGKETAPERALRAALRAAGLSGYRKNVSALPGRPDVVIPRLRVAVFVHGCFWHGCRRCARNLKPATNSRYWEAKIAINRERDERNRVALAELGYEVVTLWECELGELAPVAAGWLAARWRDGAKRDVFGI